jgi:hypothetical protein
MGGNVVSSVGGVVRRVRHSRAGFFNSRSCRGIGRCASDHDDHGRDQPYGVGMLSQVHSEWQFGAMVDNGDTPPKAP